MNSTRLLYVSLRCCYTTFIMIFLRHFLSFLIKLFVFNNNPLYFMVEDNPHKGTVLKQRPKADLDFHANATAKLISLFRTYHFAFHTYHLFVRMRHTYAFFPFAINVSLTGWSLFLNKTFFIIFP